MIFYTALICFISTYHNYSQISKSVSSISFGVNNNINNNDSQFGSKHDIASARNQMILLIAIGMTYVYTGVYILHIC